MVSLHLHAFTQSPTADRTEKLLVKSSFFLQPSWAPRKRPSDCVQASGINFH